VGNFEYLRIAKSKDMDEIYLVCKFLRKPPSEVIKLSDEDFYLCLGFAVREFEENAKMRGLL